jgi:hypothetical protein
MDVDARRQGVRCTIGEQGVCALSADCPGKAVRVPHARTDASLEVSGARSARGVCHAPVDRPVGGTVVNAAVTVVHVDAHGVAQELRTLASRHPLQAGATRGRAQTRTSAMLGLLHGSVACAPMRELRRGSAGLAIERAHLPALGRRPVQVGGQDHTHGGVPGQGQCLVPTLHGRKWPK